MLVPAVGTETSLLVIPSPQREKGFSDLKMITMSPAFCDFNTRETLSTSNDQGLAHSAVIWENLTKLRNFIIENARDVNTSNEALTIGLELKPEDSWFVLLSISWHNLKYSINKINFNKIFDFIQN